MAQNHVQQQVTAILSDPINLPAPFLDYLLQYAAINPIPSASLSAPIVNSTGLSGATKASRLVGSTTSGPPTSGTFQKGDVVPSQDGHWYICTIAGTPGTWVDAATTSIQAATVLDLAGDLHLRSTGNTMEQSSVLSLKGGVTNPYVAPTISISGEGSLSATISNKYAYVCYTWTDGGGHESAPSPVSTGILLPDTVIAESACSISVSIPTLPTGVTGFRIYALEQTGNSSTPAASTLKRQASATYVSSETTSPSVWSSYNSAGAAPPAATSFPTATNALIKDANGNTLLSADGTVRSSATTYSATPSDPTGVTGTTLKMQGLAGAFTPTGTKAAFMVSGMVGVSAATAKLGLRYGTGSAPANGDAATGTAIGANIEQINATATGHGIPFTKFGVVSGLTASTAYWFDLVLAGFSGGGAVANVYDLSLAAYDI